MTNRKLLILCSFTVALSAGCTMMDERDKARRDLDARMMNIDTQLTTSNSRIEELDNKFHLLQEKLQVIQASRQTAETAQPGLNPPEGLMVIQLEADKKQTVAVASRPKSVAAKTQPDKTDLVDEAEDSDVEQAKAAANTTPDGLYAQGQDLFIAGRYAEARQVFSELVNAFPKHGLADNALYWLGESYYSEKTFQKALAVFLDITEKYPKENKAPDAMLKAGYTYMELGSETKAEEAFTSLLKLYPNSEAAVKAKNGIARLISNKQ